MIPLQIPASGRLHFRHESRTIKPKPFVLMSLRNPYDAANFEEAEALIAVYGFKGYTDGQFLQPNIPAGVEAIFGQTKPQGRLPADIPSVTHPGTTLYPYGFGINLKTGKPL